MAKQLKLNHPWLVAVWPGMGNVALSAGYYLMAKLEMHLIAEFEARDLFDVDSVEVKEGIIQAGRRPRSRLFLWTDPNKKHDVVVFLGEAQPPIGKYQFCHKLVQHTRELGVERIFTFAAMATQMHPQHRSRVFGVATDGESLEELKRLELRILQDGQIGGLNGVLLRHRCRAWASRRLFAGRDAAHFQPASLSQSFPGDLGGLHHHVGH